MSEIIPPPAWHEDALCREVDSEIFFQEPGGNVAPAKRVCMACDVRAFCLDWALERNEPFAILGGLTEDERRKYRNLQRRNATKNRRRAVAA